MTKMMTRPARGSPMANCPDVKLFDEFDFDADLVDHAAGAPAMGLNAT